MSSTKPQAPAEPVRLRAVVGKVRDEGEKRFVVVYLEEAMGPISKDTSITFSLKAWKGEGEPMKDQMVMLEGVELFRKGWRARVAYPVTMETSKP